MKTLKARPFLRVRSAKRGNMAPRRTIQKMEHTPNMEKPYQGISWVKRGILWENKQAIKYLSDIAIFSFFLKPSTHHIRFRKTLFC
jgi:hypothetical protein